MMTMHSFRHFRAALLAALAAAALALGACSDKPAFNNLDITGSKSFGTDFSLTDHTGKRRTLRATRPRRDPARPGVQIAFCVTSQLRRRS